MTPQSSRSSYWSLAITSRCVHKGDHSFGCCGSRHQQSAWARLDLARKQLQDVSLNADTRTAAVDELAAEDDASEATALLEVLPSATPTLRQSILDAIFSRRDRIPVLLDAIEGEVLPSTALSAVQRGLLLADKDPAIRSRAEKLLTTDDAVSLEAFPRYAAALEEPRDVNHGYQVFQKTCGLCHQAHGTGFAVGPDLSSEFQRAEETIIKDVLAPVNRSLLAT